MNMNISGAHFDTLCVSGLKVCYTNVLCLAVGKHVISSTCAWWEKCCLKSEWLTDTKNVPPFHKRAITILNELLLVREENSTAFYWTVTKNEPQGCHYNIFDLISLHILVTNKGCYNTYIIMVTNNCYIKCIYVLNNMIVTVIVVMW